MLPLNIIAIHGKDLNLDSTRLVVASDIVGGNMAAVVTLMAKEKGRPKIDYQILFYPVKDADMNTESYEQFAEGPWLTKAAMEWFWNAYQPDINARKKTTISPLQVSIEQLEGLPSALIVTAENDVLRDEGEAYAHKLMQADVNVIALRQIGTIHDFMMLDALSNTPAAKSVINLTNHILQKIFEHRTTYTQ